MKLPHVLVGLTFSCLLPLSGLAAEPAKPVVERTDAATKTEAAAAPLDQAALEDAFAKKLTNVMLVGSFTAGSDGPPRKDSYTILKTAKVEGDIWSITAKIEYKGFAVPIEMRLPVKWAGDTPVISITDQKIPGFGSFTARVMFYGEEYAGTWAASDKSHGGLMWGRLQKIDAAAPAAKETGKESAPAKTPAKE